MLLHISTEESLRNKIVTEICQATVELINLQIISYTFQKLQIYKIKVVSALKEQSK